MAFSNYNWVLPRLAVGGQINSDQDLRDLIADGVTHILDVNSQDDKPFIQDLIPSDSNLEYLFNPTNDDGQTKPPSWFGPSIMFGLDALTLPHHKLYVHCAAGINRGPSTVYAIMTAFGLRADYAIVIIHQARPITIGGIAYVKDADDAITALGYD